MSSPRTTQGVPFNLSFLNLPSSINMASNDVTLDTVVSMMNMWTRAENQSYIEVNRALEHALKETQRKLTTKQNEVTLLQDRLTNAQAERDLANMDVDELSDIMQNQIEMYDHLAEENRAQAMDIRFLRQRLGLPVRRVLPASFTTVVSQAEDSEMSSDTDSEMDLEEPEITHHQMEL